MDSVLVLSEVTPLRYLRQPNVSGQPRLRDFSETTEDLTFAYRVDETNTPDLWELAYRLAWLGEGRFFVHGVPKEEKGREVETLCH